MAGDGLLLGGDLSAGDGNGTWTGAQVGEISSGKTEMILIRQKGRSVERPFFMPGSASRRDR